MTVLPRRLREPSRRDVVLGAATCAVMLGVAVAVLGKVGLMAAAFVVALAVGAVAFVYPALAVSLVLLAAFLRTAQKEIVSTEALTPAFVLMVAVVAVAVLRRAVDRPRLGPIEILMAVFLGWNVLSTAMPHHYEAQVPTTGAQIDLARWILSGVVLPFGVYLAAKTVVVDEKAVRWLLWTVVGMTAYSSWVSIATEHGPSALVWPRFIVEDPGWPGRAVGVFDQPVVQGVMLVVGIVVCLFLASRPGTQRWVSVVLWATTAAATYSVYLTHTRAAVLSLAAALVVGVVLARGWRRGFVVIGVLGLVGLASQASELLSADREAGGFGSPSEVVDRLNAAATAFRAIGENPVVGIGLGRFGMYNTYSHVAWSPEVDFTRGMSVIAHENELGVAAELGLPALGVWLAILIGILVLLRRAIRRMPRERQHADRTFLGGDLAVVAVLGLVAMLVTGTTVDLRILEFATMLPFALAGVAVGVTARHEVRPGTDTATGAGIPEPNGPQGWGAETNGGAGLAWPVGSSGTGTRPLVGASARCSSTPDTTEGQR